MSNNRYACLLAGGKGERFWPLSTSKHPKQVLSLVGGKPLLAQAVERLGSVVPPERVFIITNESLAEVCREAVPQVPEGNIIGEPCGRDTAAACALAAAVVLGRDENASLCMLTADHVIRDTARFEVILTECFGKAESGDWLITMGIKPSYASTGFGYIECEGGEDRNGVCFYGAKRFVEKPDAETATRYIASGNYFWNSGMFVWNAQRFLDSLDRFQPDLARMAKRLTPVVQTEGFANRLREEYANIGRISIDYAVMEKASNILTAETEIGWYDVGTWAALEDHFEQDQNGNIVLGRGELLDSRGNIILSEGRLTALIGVDDLVVVHAEGATLVCPKAASEQVKAMVQYLGQQGEYEQYL